MQLSMKECEIYLKDASVQVKKELYKCVSLSEIINLLAISTSWIPRML